MNKLRTRLVYDTEEVVHSDIFQADTLTKAVNDMNSSIEHIGKVHGLDLKTFTHEVDGKVVPQVRIFNLDGYLICYKTLVDLIKEGLIRVEETHDSF